MEQRDTSGAHIFEQEPEHDDIKFGQILRSR